MEHPEERYYKLNRVFLELSGLWPYQSARQAFIMRAFITVLVLSCLFPQLSSAFTSEVTIDFFVEMLPIFIPSIGTLAHLYARAKHIDKLKELFDRIWNDWALQKTEEEVKIMHKYAGTSRLLSIYFMLITCGSFLLHVVLLYIPDILDVISPMNESRPRKHYLKLEYFVPEEQYISLIRIHITIMTFIVGIVFIACLILFVAITQHVCGMCELLGYRAERLFCLVENTSEHDLSHRKLIYRNTAVFIQLHHNVTEFVGIIERVHTLPLLMDLLGGIIVMTLTFTQATFISNNMEKVIVIRTITYVNMQIIYITSYNYLSQQVTDNTSKISDKVYNSAWYDAVVEHQKPMLLIMRRQFQPVVLTACKFYVMSLSNLGKLFQTTISYSMFLRKI